MIQVLDVHDMDFLSAVSLVRHSIDTIGNKILIIIHGYGSTTNQYKKLTEIRRIGKSRIKKKQIQVSVSGPDLNDPTNRALFTFKELTLLSSYVINSGVTIMKKKSHTTK